MRKATLLALAVGLLVAADDPKKATDKADRKLCDAALSGCVAGKQLEFEISDPTP